MPRAQRGSHSFAIVKYVPRFGGGGGGDAMQRSLSLISFPTRTCRAATDASADGHSRERTSAQDRQQQNE